MLGDEAGVRAFPERSEWRKYLLSGLVECGVCGHTMAASTIREPVSKDNVDGARVLKARYICQKIATGGCGTVVIMQEPLHEWVEAQVVAALDAPELAAASAIDGQHDTADQEGALRQAQREDETLLIKLDDDMADGLLDDARWRRQARRVSERIAERRSTLAGLVVQGARPRLPEATEIRRQWAIRDVTWKQSVLRQVVDKVVIAPHPRGVATRLTPFKTETLEQFAARQDQHTAGVLAQRVQVCFIH